MRVYGLVLAAGAGSRFGGPKGLARSTAGTPWVAMAVEMLRAGGCDDVGVLVGASAAAVTALVPEGATALSVPDWRDGLSATLRAGLAAAAQGGWDAAVITPVDTPDCHLASVARVIGELRDGAPLVQAVYRGAPGHPVGIGSGHFAALADAVSGDRGARPYLAAQGVVEVEAGDLWSGADIDVRTRAGR